MATYWEYLKLDDLLSLQRGLEADEHGLMPDELHFIIVHQTMELWFKLILRELRLACGHLEEHLPEERVPYVVHHLRRAQEIVALCVHQFQVVETLTPQDFLAFRDKLVPASGFQSYQLREVEIRLGLDDAQRVALGHTGALDHLEKMTGDSDLGRRIRAGIERAQQESSLRQALHAWLHRTPIQGSSPGDPHDDEVVEGFLRDYLAAVRADAHAGLGRLIEAQVAPAEMLRERVDATQASNARYLLAEDVDPTQQKEVRRVRAALVFIESYRTLPLLAWPRTLIDTVVQLEQQFLLFRNRHARMVERLIGRRVGTGGSSGVEYLDRTREYRIFTDLWAVRTVLLRPDALPALTRPDLYGFAK